MESLQKEDRDWAVIEKLLLLVGAVASVPMARRGIMLQENSAVLSWGTLMWRVILLLVVLLYLLGNHTSGTSSMISTSTVTVLVVLVVVPVSASGTESP